MSESLLPGAYDQLVTNDLARRLEGLPADRVIREALESDLAPEILARHLYFIIRRTITSVNEANDSVEDRIALSNRIVRAIADIATGLVADADYLESSDEPILWGIRSATNDISGFHELESPTVRLSQSALLVNARNQPSIGHELNKELSTVDNVDLLCSFVMNTGLNVLETSLRKVVARGGRVRVLTTTYMGATQKKAIDRLANLGAEVRISYDGTTTRLHAKSWLLRRNSGATTGYVGSSNLSHAALTDGIEWNVRISEREQPHIIRTISSTFEDYWNDKEFEPYDPEIDADRLAQELGRAGSRSNDSISLTFANIEVSPRPYQQEVLDQLEVQRSIYGRNENLVVMATGTGKTIVAGLDYRRLVESGEVKSLLFVAHRKKILEQSLVTFRTILRDGSFGQLFVDGNIPTSWNHVFASVQSLANLDLRKIAPNAFDMIIIDEFHHAGASTYENILNHYEPKYLLGLTATPERTDGRDILHWFGNEISAELRLWEAIDRQILSPFQYFGIHDNTDLENSGIKFTRGLGYNSTELSNLYTGNDARVALILEQMNKYVGDLGELKGLGFCVSIEHARYMAEKFTLAGIPSVDVTSNISSDEQAVRLGALKSGSIKVIFAVDIFNEGIDIPDLNTLLMLRPTESATVFIQQLGRGLRKSSKKNSLTVLDFVGNQNKNFRFDLRYAKLLGVGRKKLEEAIENDFPYLPSGCHFELDEVSKTQVLNSLKALVKFDKNSFREELERLSDVSLGGYLKETGTELTDFYRNGRSFAILKNQLYEPDYVPSKLEIDVAKALGRSLHVDDHDRLTAFIDILNGSRSVRSDKYRMMLGYTLFGASTNESNLQDRLEELNSSILGDEVREFFMILDSKRSRMTIHSIQLSLPLEVHARYSRNEVLAAFEVPLAGRYGTGVIWVPDKQSDIAFVDLNKSEKHFSPTTMYADTALSDQIFQWESQSLTSDSSPTGHRYVNHQTQGTLFHLFVREFKNDPETGVTMPYMYFGPATYMSHVGNRPMRILWHLKHPIPADVLVKSKVIAS
jgi:superfamily II DNA or RNA helicase/HKD family nuclease